MNLSEKLNRHLTSIKEEQSLDKLIDIKCKELGFTKLKSLTRRYQDYIYSGNYNHEIVFYPDRNVLQYKIKEKTKGTISSRYDYKGEWVVNSSNLNSIFKDISGEFEGHE